jgi:DNA-binding PadR family transcriptional regulator
MKRNPHPAESRSLTEPTFLILLSVVDAPLHGYAIMKRVERLSAGRVRLSTGTLYGALKRLLDDRWIEPVASRPSSAKRTTRTRREYRLTGTGRKALAEEAQRLRSLAEAASKPELRAALLEPGS